MLTPARRGALSARQIEILQMLADGKSPKEVARQLRISTQTVKNHLAGVRQALGVRKTAAAAAVAFCRGLIQ